MMNKLLPEQVSRLWDYIKFAVEESLPPIVTTKEQITNNVLSALLSGKAHCWLSYRDDNGTRVFEAVVITQILYDNVSDTKNLLIYSLYGYNDISEDSWKEGLKALIKWGMSRGCSAIVGYTSAEHIKRMALKFGGEVSTFIKVPF